MNYNNIEYILEFLDKCEFEERKLVLCNLQKKINYDNRDNIVGIKNLIGVLIDENFVFVPYFKELYSIIPNKNIKDIENGIYVQILCGLFPNSKKTFTSEDFKNNKYSKYLNILNTKEENLCNIVNIKSLRKERKSKSTNIKIKSKIIKFPLQKRK